MSLAAAAPASGARRILARDEWVARGALVAVAAFLMLALGLPLWTMLSKSLQDGSGNFAGLVNFQRYFATPALVHSLWNTLLIGAAVTLITVPLAFVYAYALTRSRMPMRSVFGAIAMLPLFAPSLLPAIALIYIFGNQGFLKGFMGGAQIYGAAGIILAQVLYCFPQALLILTTALALSDARLYDAADAMGTSRIRRFLTITLPGAKYGAVSAGFVVFILVITDFGIAKVIGGQFDMLATDAYKQVVGQQNFQMGAVVGLVLLAPAVLAFFADRVLQRRQVALLSARSVAYEPKPDAARDRPLLVYCCVISLIIIGVFAVAAWASFVTYWPYNLKLSLNNYNFEAFDPAGWQPYFNSLTMALAVAAAGTAVTFSGAYLVEKTRGAEALRGFIHVLAMLPMAVPGLVLGLAYVFFFVAKWNPLNVFYGTLILLTLNCIAHFYTVGHLTATTALKQIDPEFESVSASLKVPFYVTFFRVTLPVCMPAVMEIFIYFFVNALTTVSAVIFLYGPDTRLASVSIVHMDEAGQSAAAAGLATLILLTALVAKLLQLALAHFAFARLQAWRKR